MALALSGPLRVAVLHPGSCVPGQWEERHRMDPEHRSDSSWSPRLAGVQSRNPQQRHLHTSASGAALGFLHLLLTCFLLPMLGLFSALTSSGKPYPISVFFE